VIRYGDEIGMGDNLAWPERNCAAHGRCNGRPSRMPASPKRQAVLAGHRSGTYGYEHSMSPKQAPRHQFAMLTGTERVIRMRKEVPEVGWGDFQVIATRDPSVLIVR